MANTKNATAMIDLLNSYTASVLLIGLQFLLIRHLRPPFLYNPLIPHLYDGALSVHVVSQVYELGSDPKSDLYKTYYSFIRWQVIFLYFTVWPNGIREVIPT